MARGEEMLQDALRGAISGAVGTTLMSEILAFARTAGFFPRGIPQEQIGEGLQDKAGIGDALPEGAQEAGWITAHFMYGTVAGAVYGVLLGRLRLRAAFVPAGAVLGLSLWALGFAGWAPLAGLYPALGEDDGRQVGAQVAAHLVYGGVTSTLFWLLGRSRPLGS